MPHIMIVDDDPAILRSLRGILEEEGHTVDEAPDGEVALIHFAGNPADLVICDVFMPNMNGIEFVMRVLEAFPEAKIVGLSGGGFLSQGTVLEAVQKVGAVGILKKPFGIEDVIRVVDKALASGQTWTPWTARGAGRIRGTESSRR